MIPTKLKSRISKELSFPLGAKTVSEALEGVPQYADLTLAFYPHWDLTPPRIRRMLDSDEPIRIMEATYRNIPPGRSGSRDLMALGWYDETWELAVYPVPRDMKSAIAALLVTKGLPKIRMWLEMKRADSWHSGRHSCRLLVRFADEGTLLCEGL